MKTPEAESGWKSFYKVAGTTALLLVLVGLMDTITSMLGGEARENSAISVVEWFSLFQTNRLTAMGNLGIFNILTLSLGIPIYLALVQIHRKQHLAFAALAAILFWIGAAIYLASNTVFSMQALSSQYAAASEAQKPLLEAAGRAVLAMGADLTPGTYLGLLFSQLAGMIMALVILRSGWLPKWAAWVGFAGFFLSAVFFTLAAFWPTSFSSALLIAMPGGISLLVYHVVLARKFFQLSKTG